MRWPWSKKPIAIENAIIVEPAKNTRKAKAPGEPAQDAMNAASAELREAEMFEKMKSFMEQKGFVVTPSGQKIMKEKLSAGVDHVADTAKTVSNAVVDGTKATGYTVRGLFRKATDPVVHKLHDLRELGKEPR